MPVKPLICVFLWAAAAEAVVLTLDFHISVVLPVICGLITHEILVKLGWLSSYQNDAQRMVAQQLIAGARIQGMDELNNELADLRGQVARARIGEMVQGRRETPKLIESWEEIEIDEIDELRDADFIIRTS